MGLRAVASALLMRLRGGEPPLAALSNPGMQLAGATHPELRPVLIADGDQRTVEFDAVGPSPAADAQFR